MILCCYWVTKNVLFIYVRMGLFEFIIFFPFSSEQDKVHIIRAQRPKAALDGTKRMELT